MLKIRQSVFETNSSSTHSLILCSDEDYAKLNNEELFIDWGGKLRTKEERDEKIQEILAKHPEYNVDDLDLSEWGFSTLDQWWDDEDLEYGHDEFETPNGEIVHAVYKYGYDS